MKQLRINIRRVGIFLCALFVVMSAYGVYSVAVNGSRWFSSASNTFVRSKKKSVIPGRILDRNNYVLADNDHEQLNADGMPKRKYHDEPTVRTAMVHVVGDEKDRVKNGVESFMTASLYGFDMSMGERISCFIQGKKRIGDDVYLTVDEKLSSFILYGERQKDNLYGAPQEDNIVFPADKKGAVVVMNYQTGEVLAEVSLPHFDPLASASEDAALNRAVRVRYAPGSTFKIVTAAATIENDADAAIRAYQCAGELQVGDGSRNITDAGGDAHGQLTLQKAFQESCNNAFARIAMNLGDEKLRKTAENFGFNDNFLFRTMVVENSSYPTENRTETELAWTGVGQSELLVTPMHMCLIAAAVANDGVMMEPYVVAKTVANNGTLRSATQSRVYRQAMEPETAALIKEYMRLVVTGGTGKSANITGVRVCGKTGSAEVDTQENTNAWFVGFIDDAAHPYAIAVVVEDAGGGGSVAAPIARQVFEWMLQNGY